MSSTISKEANDNRRVLNGQRPSKEEERWEDYDQLYIEAAKNLANNALMIQSIFNSPDFIKKAGHTEEAKLLIMSLQQIAEELTAELVGIKASHANYHGLITDATYYKAVEVYEMYHAFNIKMLKLLTDVSEAIDTLMITFNEEEQV